MMTDQLAALVETGSSSGMLHDRQGRLVVDTTTEWRQWLGDGPRRALPGALVFAYRDAEPAALTVDLAVWVASLPTRTRLRLRLRKAWREVTS